MDMVMVILHVLMFFSSCSSFWVLMDVVLRFQDWAMRRQMQMQMQIPSFGNWECYDDLPVTQYFDSTRYGGHLRHHFYMEDAGHDLFKIPPSPLPYQYHLVVGKQHSSFSCPSHFCVMIIVSYLVISVDSQTQTRKLNKEKKHQKQRRVCDENQQKLQQEETIYRQRTPKAVDEDLYKIPPELLYQKPKKDVRKKKKNQFFFIKFYDYFFLIFCLFASSFLTEDYGL